MLNACFTLIALCFVYTSWHFYAFYGTNLLTRCHSASSLFSIVFVFQKSLTGNILEIGRNETRSSYFFQHETESKVETEEGTEVATPPSGTGAPLAAPPPGVGPSGGPLTSPLHLYKASDAKTLNESVFFPEKLCGDPAYHYMCSMQVVDITPMKHRLTSITSIRVVQQKHQRSKVCL
jgi:hypothetical protein